MVDALPLYDQDFLAWTQDQAAALRDAARLGANMPLDWENLAEEIESLGKSLRRELRSRIGVILEHLLKLEHSTSQEPRAGWMETVDRERSEIELLLEQNPSLRREVGEIITKEMPRAVRFARRNLERHGETGATRLASAQYAEDQYAEDQILGDWWPGQDGGA